MTYKHPYILMLSYVVGLAAVGCIVGDPSTIIPGLKLIVTSPAALIVDYIEFAGPAAAFVNAALVTLISIIYIKLVKAPINGMSPAILSLMSGFALFGKNIYNMIPILIGGYLSAKIKKVDPATTCYGALMVCCMGPVVSFLSFGINKPNIILGLLVGILLGFIVPAFGARTAPFQNGYNLYNTGFCSGLLAILFNTFFLACGETPATNSIWATAYDNELRIVFVIFNVGLLIAGLFFMGKKPGEVLLDYRNIMKKVGYLSDDYLVQNGGAASCVNCGINGLICCAIITGIGGNFSGPVLAGMLAVMGFSFNGKHTKNIVPLFIGMLICAVFMPGINLQGYAVQNGSMFVTACAPFCGAFGPVAGLFAGFFHCFLVQKTAGFGAGFNLYNNGLSAGLVVAFLYPMVLLIKEIIEKNKKN